MNDFSLHLNGLFIVGIVSFFSLACADRETNLGKAIYSGAAALLLGQFLLVYWPFWYDNKPVWPLQIGGALLLFAACVTSLFFLLQQHSHRYEIDRPQVFIGGILLVVWATGISIWFFEANSQITFGLFAGYLSAACAACGIGFLSWYRYLSRQPISVKKVLSVVILTTVLFAVVLYGAHFNAMSIVPALLSSVLLALLGIHIFAIRGAEPSAVNEYQALLQRLPHIISTHDFKQSYREIVSLVLSHTQIKILLIGFWDDAMQRYEVSAGSYMGSEIEPQSLALSDMNGLQPLITQASPLEYVGMDNVGTWKLRDVDAVAIGETKHWHCICHPIVADGSCRGAIVCVTPGNFTNKKMISLGALMCSIVFKNRRAEAELEEARVLERQLLRAQKMEAVGQLASGVAHDFNNLLSGISGYTHLLLKKYGTENPDLKKYLNPIQSAAKSAAELTDKLLGYSRKSTEQFETFDLHRSIEDVVKILERTLPADINLLVYLDATPSTINGSSVHIQNAILNLAINARDAISTKGAITIRTEVENLDNDTDVLDLNKEQFLSVSVSDTGSGMDDEVKEKIFNPFFTTKDVGKGTGLGLSSVQATIKKHHARLRVNTRIGEGTTITMSFPLDIDSGVKPLVENKIERAEQHYQGSGNVVVVDDEELVCDLVTAMLTYWGYSVVAFKRARQAVDYCANLQNHIDLILTDVVMPEINGIELIKRIRAVRPEQKIVAMTGYAVQRDLDIIGKLRIQGLVKKPFDSSNLSKLIQEIISEQIVKQAV